MLRLLCCFKLARIALHVRRFGDRFFPLAGVTRVRKLRIKSGLQSKPDSSLLQFSKLFAALKHRRKNSVMMTSIMHLSPNRLQAKTNQNASLNNLYFIKATTSRNKLIHHGCSFSEIPNIIGTYTVHTCTCKRVQ